MKVNYLATSASRERRCTLSSNWSNRPISHFHSWCHVTVPPTTSSTDGSQAIT